MSRRATAPRLAVVGLAVATGLVAAPALAAVGDDAPTAAAASTVAVTDTARSVTATRAADARQVWVKRYVPSTASARPRLVAAPPAPAPAPVAAPKPKGLQPQPDGLNWAALAKCESGGNPKIVNRTGKYHGLYQFDRSTWQSVGGSGVASTAPAAEQTARAQMLYAKRGASPWPECGRRL